jgi:hypothetical protein
VAVMKRSLPLLIGLTTAIVACQIAHCELPDAPVVTTSPKPVTVHHDYLRNSLLAGVLMARAADWASTEQCLREPAPAIPTNLPIGMVHWKREGCREAILPSAIAGNKFALAMFEASMFSGEVMLSNRLARHHHRLALALDAVSFAATSATAAHNYQIAHSKLTRTVIK